MITITYIYKMTKTITMIKVRLGEMLIALLLGEFLHRLVLIFEELPHVKERWDKKTKYQNTKYQNKCISLPRRREALFKWFQPNKDCNISLPTQVQWKKRRNVVGGVLKLPQSGGLNMTSNQ